MHVRSGVVRPLTLPGVFRPLPATPGARTPHPRQRPGVYGLLLAVAALGGISGGIGPRIARRAGPSWSGRTRKDHLPTLRIVQLR